MSVRILSEAQKDLVVNFYVNEHFSIRTIADGFNVSDRTIGRVLDERGYSVINRKPHSVPYTEQTAMDLKYTIKRSWWSVFKEKCLNWIINGQFQTNSQLSWKTNEFVSYSGNNSGSNSVR